MERIASFIFLLKGVHLMQKKLIGSEDAEPPLGEVPLIKPIKEPKSYTPDLFDFKPARTELPSYRDLIKKVSKMKEYFTVSLRTTDFREKFYPEINANQWNDWHWQLKNRIEDLSQLEKIVALSNEEREALTTYKGGMSLAITPYYASLLDKNDFKQAIRKIVIPTTSENIHSPGESEDPLGEDSDCKVHGLIHRYPDRVLFLVTNYCSSNCRYCTRSRMIKSNNKYPFNMEQWEEAIRYIERTPSIRDVLLSGGDPLSLSDNKIEWLLSRLRCISHVEIIRIGTRIPVVLPQRITPNLLRVLRRYHPLWLSIHFTHPDEITSEVSEACGRLADAGIPLGSQTVLLKGINDNVETMKNLVHGLLKSRVKPYYLYQCDPIVGSSHFRTSIKKGLEIIKGLRGYTSGYAVPTYVIDAPGGGGKIPLLPDYYQGREGDDVLLKNYKDKIYRYPDYIKDAV